MQRYDVVIIGGGMTGVSLALGLSESSLRIAVIDQQSLSAEGVASGSTYSSRVSALTYATVALFKRYGVWELMRDQRVCPYRYYRSGMAKVPEKSALMQILSGSLILGISSKIP